MSYITRNDLLVYIRDEHIDDIASWQEFEIAINIGMGRVKTYLSDLYEIEQEFQRVEQDRDVTLVQCCISVALYNLYKRLPNRKYPEYMQVDYTETIQLLERISDGKMSVQIPRKILADNSDASAIRFNPVKQRNL